MLQCARGLLGKKRSMKRGRKEIATKEKRRIKRVIAEKENKNSDDFTLSHTHAHTFSLPQERQLHALANARARRANCSSHGSTTAAAGCRELAVEAAPGLHML